MEISPEQEHDQAIAPPQEYPGSRQFKGVRLREWGKWVSEIRMTRSRKKIWLGSFGTPEQAARAYDAASYFLRGPGSQFNFPDSVPNIPPAFTLSPGQIKKAAQEYASGQPLSSLPSLENNIEQSLPSLENNIEQSLPSLENNVEHNNNEEHALLSQSSSVSEMEVSSDRQQISDEWEDLEDLASMFAEFTESDGTGLPNSGDFPPIDDLSTPDLFPASQEQGEESYISADLWDF